MRWNMMDKATLIMREGRINKLDRQVGWNSVYGL